MAQELKTKKGRAKRRERVAVEHALSRVGAIQGKRSRYIGLEKNQFDLQRVAVVNNCFVLANLLAA
jgi:IS5 family transposase